ncbi:sensor histidine kinase [Pseudobacter ginsenosidimutans]|uniref:Histidine kinase n=1 Tax=Pseudobacter ginsenosidimutans TaxID=661488 RepID=A0A4Q7MZ43_9BACT|nr:histidine kinase [Pseudobacter ginsenosidimutans]QEC42871.1 histidine kinase [Pseudobacter ginsenosidimutans]RZS74223.1 histidine kinase [Pseudobacter ginsenosidimutans]
MTFTGRYIRLMVHLFGWMLVGFIMILQLRMVLGVSLPAGFYAKQAIMLSLLIIYFYINECIIVRRLLYKQKLAGFFTLHLGIIASLQVTGRILDIIFNLRHEIIKAIFKVTHVELNPKYWGNLDATLLLTSIVVAGISTCIALIQHWQFNLRASEEIRKKQLDAELALLKAQIHPHFFFNTLNNIYALSYDNAESSRTSLYKLSRMMRYLLYETPNNLTRLSKEIGFVKDYIELMSLRMSDSMNIRFEVPETVSERSIAPMILLPFIENAFKHGVSSLRNGSIIIRISQDENILKLYVENQIFKEHSVKIEDGGIGLNNTERRLQMTYPDQHRLQYGKTENGSYIVQLELML